MSEGREIDLALMMADLCGYTALTETHGAFVASEIVLRFVGLVKESMTPGVRIVDCIGDEVFCCSDDSALGNGRNNAPAPGRSSRSGTPRDVRETLRATWYRLISRSSKLDVCTSV